MNTRHVSTLTMCAIALAWAFSLFAQTKVGGVLSGENRWDLAGSPYIVECDLLVPRFAHLTVDPGVKVIINKQRYIPEKIAQFDALDSGSISIRVEGTLSCVGKRNKRVVFAPQEVGENRLGWYGIIFEKVNGKFNEIAFTDLTGAFNGITARECNPLVRNCIIEGNNIGINCLANGSALVFNCIVTNNYAAGIRVQEANPHIANSIIVKNRNNGLWCDGASKVTFEYNCVFGNRDGNFLDCDPRYGRLTRVTKAKDSVDAAWNFYRDPVFFGTQADSIAFAHDVMIPTDSSKVKNKRVAKMVQKKPRDSSFGRYRKKTKPRYTLSRYSPCVNNGDPESAYRDADGSRNDIGLYGGPEFFARGKE
jgi:hypothetical protein